MVVQIVIQFDAGCILRMMVHVFDWTCQLARHDTLSTIRVMDNALFTVEVVVLVAGTHEGLRLGKKSPV